jgi:hypothetical protein
LEWLRFFYFETGSKRFQNLVGRPRAHHVSPSPYGELYSYFVDKFWIVQAVLPDGRLQLRTHTGKTHLVNPRDPHLSRARWWRRWLYKNRYREIAELAAQAAVTHSKPSGGASE